MSVINTNVAANSAYLNLSRTSGMLQKSIQKLSSGFRINRSADDAAGASIANGLRATARSLQAAQRNATQANAVLQIADGAVNTVAGILDRMKELAAQAASDNSDATARTNLDAEYTALVAEMDRIADTTKYGATVLTNGSASTLTFLVGSSGDYAAGDTVTVDPGDVDLSSATLLGAAAGSLTSLANAQGELTKIDTAITNLGTAIGVIGAAQSRIEFASSNVAITYQNVVAAESSIRDADMAFEMTQFTKAQILQQAGTAMLAQANQTPQTVLSLLRS
ncbi:MAG TPA: flagellin [Gemmatimonadales bacterium]|nr:flagellin [Gemmatimonadales bacterium]